MKKNKSEKIWSLNIKFNVKYLDEQMKKYVKVCEEKIGFIPNVIKANASENSRLKVFVNFYNRLMLDKGHLNKLEREMIAVVVSSINRCYYCLVAHSASVRLLSKNPILSEKLAINYLNADITDRQKSMLNFASKLTIDPHLIKDKDRNTLRDNGFSDRGILEIIEVASFFNMTNRIASGTNMNPNNEYHNIGR